ncbi:MAG: hypothetical protein ACK4K9_04670 [Bacteroidia bacterium]
MKNIFIILIILTTTFQSCEEDKVKVIFTGEDTTQTVMSESYSGDNYGGSIPYLDSKVIDYSLPDEYQKKPQVTREGIVIMSWDDAGFKDAKRFIKFVEQFQFLVKDRNKEKIATYIDFPLKNIKTRKEFIDNFDAIFHESFTNEVLYQNPQEIYRDKNGAMIGKDGQIWFKPKGGSYRIVSINF